MAASPADRAARGATDAAANARPARPPLLRVAGLALVERKIHSLKPNALFFGRRASTVCAALRPARKAWSEL